MNSLSWIFRLFDQFSGPAGKIERAIRRMGVAQAQAMEMDKRRTRSFETAVRRMGVAQSQANVMDERRTRAAQLAANRQIAAQQRVAAQTAKATRSMGVAQAQAGVMDERRDLLRIRRANRQDMAMKRWTRNMGVAHTQAIVEDERRTRAAQRAVDRQAAAQQRAAATAERTTRRTGTVHAQALAEEERRTRRMGTIHAQALADEERRTRRMGTIHAQALAEDARRAQGTGHRGLFNGIAGMGLGIAGLYITFRALTAMVQSVARAATAIPRGVIGSGIEHTAMKESAVAGMGVVLGSESLAQKMVKEAVRFAAITPMTTEEALKGYQQLIMGGIAPNKVLGVMSAVSDLSSMNMARRPEAVETISQDLMQIQSAGKVSGRHLRNLSHWGLPREELFKQFTQILPALHGATPDVVEKAVSAGKVSAEAFFLALERTMAVKGGGKVGGISEKLSHTVLGLWSTLISRPQELMMHMDKTPAWSKLKTALENLANVTDLNTPMGARIQESLSNAFSKWVDKLTGWLQDPKKVEEYVDRMLTSFEKAIPAFEKMVGVLPAVADGLTKIGGIFEFLGLVSKVPTPAGPGILSDASAGWWDTVKGGRGWELFRGPAAVPAGSKKVGANTTAHVNVTVNGASREDAKVVGHEVRSQVAEMFEQMGIEVGAAGVP